MITETLLKFKQLPARLFGSPCAVFLNKSLNEAKIIAYSTVFQQNILLFIIRIPCSPYMLAKYRCNDDKVAHCPFYRNSRGVIR